MENYKKLEIIESVYGLNINNEVLVELFTVTYHLMFNENLFNGYDFNYDALRFDIISKQGEYADCDWYLEKVEGVLNYYTEPMVYINYTDEEGHVECKFEFINKKLYNDMVKLFYKQVIKYFLER